MFFTTRYSFSLQIVFLYEWEANKLVQSEIFSLHHFVHNDTYVSFYVLVRLLFFISKTVSISALSLYIYEMHEKTQELMSSMHITITEILKTGAVLDLDNVRESTMKGYLEEMCVCVKLFV